MEDGLLNLKWNSQKNTFFEILKIQREKSNYTDATLAVEGKFYPVHKLVMSICSEYFNDIFEKTACKSPVIVLKDVRSHDIEALLDYMYLGEVNVNQNDLTSVLKTAKSLRIKGLAIPDQDTTRSQRNSNKSLDDTRHDSPPPKRRRHVSDTIQRPVASPVPSQQKSASTFVSPSVVPSSTSNSSNIEKSDPPFVKVEIVDEPEEITYEGDFKKEPEPEDTGNTSLPGPSSLQQSFPLNSDQDDLPDVKDVEVVEVENYNAQELEERFGENDYEYDVNTDYDIFAGPSSLQQTVLMGRRVGNTTSGKNTSVQYEKAYACQQCSYRAYQKGDLTKHIRVHTGEKPYACQYCSFRSSQSSALKQHLRIHTGEKPYVCPHCPYQSSQKNSLILHLTNHDKEENLKSCIKR